MIKFSREQKKIISWAVIMGFTFVTLLVILIHYPDIKAIIKNMVLPSLFLYSGLIGIYQCKCESKFESVDEIKTEKLHRKITLFFSLGLSMPILIIVLLIFVVGIFSIEREGLNDMFLFLFLGVLIAFLLFLLPWLIFHISRFLTRVFRK
jgi:TctA family transporter